jgi:hypothetical protein
MQNNRTELHSRRGAVARCLNLTILTLAIATCGFLRDVAAQQTVGRVRDAENGFSFVPPAGWEASSLRPDPKVRLMYLGPNFRGGRTNLNLVVEADTGESFDAIAEQIKLLYPRLFHAWKLAEESPLEIGGKQAYYLSATHRMGSLTQRQAQFLVRGGNGKIYIVTFAAGAGDFDRLSPAIAQSALSIKIE